jgi:hypothetical protein
MKITKPDTSNTDPEYWEEVLTSYGLGRTYLKLDGEPEIEDEPVFVTIDEFMEYEQDE